MTIKKKISKTFATLTAIILITLSVAVYFFSYIYTKREFYFRLKERAYITAENFLTDDASSKIIEEIRKKFLRTLPEEEEYLIPIEGIINAAELPDSIRTLFPTHFLQEIINNNYAEFGFGDYSALGITYQDHHGEFIIIVSAVDIYGFAKLANLRNILLIFTLIYVLMAYFIGNWYARQTLEPIIAIIDRVNQIRVSKLNTRIEVPKEKDEISDLILTFNQMLDRLETAIATQNNFISNASHELKNPLTAILGTIEIAMIKERGTDEYVKFMDKIAKDATRLETLTLRLLKLAQTNMDEDSAKKDFIRIDELLLDLKSDFLISHPDYNFKLLLNELPDDAKKLTVYANEELLKIAFSQLIENSFKFSEQHEVAVSLAVFDNLIEVTISDQGVGIPEEEQAEIFIPFFRATNVRKFRGFGIGLPMAKRIFDMNEAEVKVKSKKGEGTTFFINLNSVEEG